MHIIIEGNSIEWDLSEKNVLLKQIIEEVETFLLSVSKVPTALSVNGRELTQEELESLQEKPIRGDEVLEFGVLDLSQFVAENLEGTQKANEELVKNITTFANELYSTTKTVDPTSVIENLKHFYFFWVRLYQLLPNVFEETLFDGKKFHEISDQIQNIFKEIVEAMEEDDCVLAADLLQYEVVPIIESIGKSIPSIKENVLSHSSLNEEEEKIFKSQDLKKVNDKG